MTLLRSSDQNSREINVALLSLEADIKNKITNFDTSVIDKQLVEINNRIDKINAGDNNTSAAINDIRYEIEDINSKLKGNSAKIENIEQKLSDIFSAENKVTDFNTTTNSGIYYWVSDAANRPIDYGVLLVNKYDDGRSIWINQIAYGTNSKIYFRQNINSGNWTEWKAVAFDGEIIAKKVANALTVNGKTYDGSEAVDAGVQTVANGGTGATTALGAFESLANGLPEGAGPLDTEHIIFQNENRKNWGLYTLSQFWEYIKGKISSVLGLTKDNYGGKSAQAGFLNNYSSTRITSGNIVPKDASEYGGMRKDTVTSSMTDSGRPGKDGHLLTMFWDGAGRWDSQLFIANDVGVSPELKLRSKQDTADYGAWTDIITSNNIGSQTVSSASTAGTADKTVNDISIDVPWTNESGQYVIPLGNILEPTSTAIESPYNWDITGFFSIIRPSGHNGSHLWFEAGHGYSHDWTTYAYLDKLDFRRVTTSIKAFQYNGKWWLGLCIITGHQGYASKMTITYSRGLPATPTCILFYSRSNGVVNEEINNSIQDIPSSWWRTRTIHNPTIFTTAMASSKMVIPIGAPSSLEDGCIWIER